MPVPLSFRASVSAIFAVNSVEWHLPLSAGALHVGPRLVGNAETNTEAEG